MASHHPIRKVVTPEIPDKLYFRIGDVARICEVPAYVLRFWETEFPQLKPNKGGTGQRLYRKRDVEMALRIKSLLYDQGYTIPGARQVFKSEGKPKETSPGATAAETAEGMPRPPADRHAAPNQASAASDGALRQARLQTLRDEMQELLRTLSSPVGSSTSSSPATRTKLHALRPRLVPEAGTGAPRPAPLRALSRFGDATRDASRERQTELFSSAPLTMHPEQPDPLHPDSTPSGPFSSE